MRRTGLAALLSHWRRQPLQLVTLVLGLALATGLWSAVQAINGQARASYAQAAEQLGANRLLGLTAPNGSIPVAQYVQLRRAGWQLSPILEGRVRLNSTTISLLGVDSLSYPVPPAPASDQETLDPADILTAPGRLFAHPETADKLAVAALPAPLIVTDHLPVGIVLTDIAIAESLLERSGEISRILVLPDQPAGLVPLSDIAPDLVLSEPNGDADIARLTDSFHLNLTAFGLLSFAVGLFIVNGTVGLAFHQRRGMFRSLRALGVPLGVLTELLLFELLALALLAGFLGLIIGYLVAAALLPDVAASLRGLYGAPVTGTLTLRPAWIASGLAIALLGALIAGGQGVWHLHRLPILAAPGLQSWRLGSASRDRTQALTGVGLVVGGFLVQGLAQGLIAGFALLAGLMLGAALLLPPILGQVLGWISARARDPVAQWVWADLRSHMPGLSLALMALLLALATNIGVGTMVSSFRLTFTGWLDQRLASELYVTARSDDEGAAIRDWLLSRSDAVLPIRYGELRLADQPGRVYGIADHATYRDHWPLIEALPGVWDRLHTERTVLINEQLARRTDLWPGDEIALRSGWTVEIVGVYSDYGNPNAQAIVSLPALLLHVPSVPNRQFGVRIAPDLSVRLVDELRSTFGLPTSAIVDQAAIKARSLGVFEKTFVVTGALNVLTLGAASFAILTSLLTLWTLRLPQLAPVWALGLTRKRLAWLEVLRSVALTALTACLALPLGLALAWVLLDVINVEAFGWRLPMHLFPLDWARLAVLALIAGGIAAVIPARRLRTTPPADMLRVFSNER
ncbi:ABC transporter permease [Sedimentitalea todarodis]|uniref:ABC transporter permease n=1 Tax=Sedimentitalea todarodis TaxID=1631240 RepID=A0ABU3VAW1_9RHOB|nr:ABC transporter permease [Sedimentitalea todarodis]MDU9003311.1 ABC transporter permease [Sedimentitalea todarodis]